MMGIVLFKTALAVYLVCAVVYGASLWVRRVLTARFATGLMFAALVIHTFSFASRWLTAGMSPAVGIHDALSFFAWVMAAAYLALQLKTKTRVLGAFVSPVICLIMVVASVELGGTVGAPAMLQGSLVTAPRDALRDRRGPVRRGLLRRPHVSDPGQSASNGRRRGA